MQGDFFFMFTIWTNGRSKKVSLPQIIPSEDFVLTKQPKEGGDLQPILGAQILFQRGSLIA